MAISTTMLQNDLDAMIADLGCTIVWGSQTVTGTRSETNEQNDVEDEGILENVDLVVVSSVDDWTTIPGVQKVVQVDGTKYYIENKMTSQDGIAVTFQLRRI